MKDLTHTMEISMKEEAEEEARAAEEEREKSRAAGTTSTPGATKAELPTRPASNTNPDVPAQQPTSAYVAPSVQENISTAPVSSTTSTSAASQQANPYTQDRPKGVPTRLALTDRASADAALNVAGVTDGEKELRAKEKKKGLTKEQREELRAYEIERTRVRDERVETLAAKLRDRLSVWTETDKGKDVTAAFVAKTRLEVESLTMESFGLEILHAIGTVYMSKATAVLKSQRMFGIGGIWSRIKDKGALAKDTWGTISTAIDAQMSMEAMAKAEELGGEEWTDERRAEHEKRVTGKILAAAWRGSKMEIQSVLRDVCDSLLSDRKVKAEKRVERAQALLLMGECFAKAARDPDEEGEYLVFEQLMAEAMAKREKKEDKKKKREKDAAAAAAAAGVGVGVGSGGAGAGAGAKVNGAEAEAKAKTEAEREKERERGKDGGQEKDKERKHHHFGR